MERTDNVATLLPGSNLKVCARCGNRYDWRKSPSSSLKMTYCGSLCERADLGFTIDALLDNVQAVPSAWRELLLA